MSRYGPTLMPAPGGRVDVNELLAFIDRIEVCTTCGWSRSMHEVEESGVRVVGLCAHWTRAV